MVEGEMTMFSKITLIFFPISMSDLQQANLT